MNRMIRFALLSLLVFTASAHADQEKTGRRAPHYIGKAAPVTAVAHVPVLTGQSFGEPVPAPDLAAMVDAARVEFDAYLQSLIEREPLSMEDYATGAPAVYVGSPDGFYAPQRLHVPAEEQLPRDAVIVRTIDPTGPWKKRLQAAAAEASASHVLVVALELSDYPVSQKNWKGSKAVDLAAGHTMPIPWLTSLDQPVEVIQWTGALYRADGKFVRGGAEAFEALRTPFKESAFHVQRTMTPVTLEEALAARRDDLPGSPLAWEVAMKNLVAELLGKPGREGVEKRRAAK
jgi:hypothetical protein